MKRISGDTKEHEKLKLEEFQEDKQGQIAERALRKLVDGKERPKGVSESIAWDELPGMKLEAGGSLYKYYPLNEEGRQEYEAWRREQK